MAVMIQHLASSASSLPTNASAFDASISALNNCISALESSIKTSEGASGFWERVAWSCAIAVGIGIVGEIVVIVHDFFEERSGWRRGIVRPPDHPTVWIFWFDIAATLLVLAGVFGEAGASMKLAAINSELRSKTSELRGKSDQLIALVTAEAGTDASSEEREKGAADKADGDAGDAQKKAEAVGKQAKLIDLELAMTQYLMTGREVKDPDSLKGQLAQFAGQPVIFRSYVNDGEGYFLCEEILSAAHSAGMLSTDECARWTFAGAMPQTGIFVSGGPDDNSMLNLGQIMGRLTAFGGGSGPFGKNAQHPSTFIVFVGARSPFTVGQARPTPLPKKSSPAKK